MITFVCWKWRSRTTTHRAKYTAEHANVWNASLRRNYKGELRTICITDDPEGVDFETFPLWQDCSTLSNPSGAHLPSCYRRLRIFDPLATSEMDIEEGSKVVSCDLDVVYVRDVTPMFRYDEDFRGWRGVGAYNPVVYNGTLFMFRAGRMQRLWREFDPSSSPLVANKARYFGSDQGWISYMLAGKAPGWGPQDGIYSYTSDMNGSRGHLPHAARIVSFNGKRKPWEDQVRRMSPWIEKHWRL